MLKTCKKDFKYAFRFLKSYTRYNRDNIPLYIVMGRREMQVFREIYRYKDDNVSYIEEEKCPYLLEKKSVKGLSKEYLNQEIIKLWFWETQIAENYLCVDSDAVFIRDFYISDFMYDDSTPYSVLCEDKDLKQCHLL